MHQDELRQLLLTLAKNNVENEDADFKRELRIQDRADKAEMIRDILSLANPTDRSTREDAYLIVGAKGGRLFDVSPLQLDDAAIRSIVQSFISPHLSVRYFEVDNGEGGRLGAVIIERNGNWHIVKRELRSTDQRELFLMPGQTWSRNGSKKYHLDGDEIIRIMGEETQRRLAEAMSPMVDRVRASEQHIAELQAETTRIRPQLSAKVLNSNGASEFANIEKQDLTTFYDGPDLGSDEILSELRKLGPRPKTDYVIPKLEYRFRLFETKRERVAVNSEELSVSLKELFSIDVDPELLRCEDVTRIESEDPTSSAALLYGRGPQVTYDGRDADRYTLVHRLEVAVESARTWIEYRQDVGNIMSLPFAVFNDGRAPATGIVVEINVPIDLHIIKPWDVSKMPDWAIRQIYGDTRIKRDRAWMWRPKRHIHTNLVVDNYTYTARERTVDLPFGKPYETDVLRYHYRSEIIAGEGDHSVWRYRVETEVPHGEGVCLSECLILAPAKDGEFHLKYSIRARELPEPVNGTFTIVVNGFESL